MGLKGLRKYDNIYFQIVSIKITRNIRKHERNIIKMNKFVYR